MSYESKLDNHSGKFISPTQLCLLLSVGIHLLILKFGLPTIRFNNDSGRREVSIIELNPEQQSRLPDLSPQLDTPDVPDISNLPEPDSSDPVAPFAIPPSLIPGIGDNSNLPALTIPPPPEFDLPPLPPQTDITLPPIGDLSALPLPPEIEPSDFKADPIKLPPNTGETTSQPSDSTLRTPPPQPTQSPQTTTTKPQPEETKPEPQPQLTQEQIAAIKLAASQERIDKLRQSMTKTEAGTTDEDARKNYVAWLAKVEDIKPDKIEIEGTYPRDACIRRLEGTSVFGVVANEQGQVVALDLIKGAKYAVFNQQASQELSDRTLDNPTDKPKPYQVTVNYKYDAEICPSLTLPSLRDREQQPQTKPQAAPEPEAETTPEPQPEVQPPVEPEAETTPEPQPEAVPEAETTPEPQPEAVPEAETTPPVEPQPEPEAETTPPVEPQPEPETTPPVEPQPEPETETTPPVEPQPEPETETTPPVESEPEAEPEPLPSLRDRLRDVPLQDLDPAKLKDIPLPDRSSL